MKNLQEKLQESISDNKKIKVIEGHLTLKEKNVIKDMIANDMMEGQVKKDIYKISKNEDGTYTLILYKWDRGIIPVAGSKFRHTKYTSKFTIK